MKAASFTKSILVVAAVASLATIGSTFAKQPHMDEAIDLLQQARGQLQEAAHDKAGWRVEAIKQINAAIASIQQGKEAAR